MGAVSELVILGEYKIILVKEGMLDGMEVTKSKDGQVTGETTAISQGRKDKELDCRSGGGTQVNAMFEDILVK